MPAPRTSTPSTTTGSDALLYLLFGVLGAAVAFDSLAWLTGNLTNALVGTGPWAPFKATDALLHPDVLWPHLSPTALLVGARFVPGLHHPREMWWDILADARDLAGAKRLAAHSVAASVDESSDADFWSTAASNTLGALFLAAASHRRPITDVLAWLASPADRIPSS